MIFLPWHAREYAQLAERAAALPHALLFRGPAGIGKLAFVQALSKRLLCENPGPGLDACGKCPACHWFDAGTHPDFRLVEPDSASDDGESGEGEIKETKEKKKSRLISVDQVRALADFVGITSHRGGVKIVVIHPAEAMNPNAANALLKNLEEPPPRTHFLLVSHRPNLLLATIKSRCQQIALTIPDASAAAEWLKTQEGGGQPELALAQAGGLPLLAARLDTPDYWAERSRFLNGLAAEQYEPLALAEHAAALPVPQTVSWLQKWTFDLVSLKFLRKIRYNPDYQTTLAPTAKAVDGLSALRFHRELVRLQRVIEHPLNARLLFEDLLLAYGRLTKAARR